MHLFLIFLSVLLVQELFSAKEAKKFLLTLPFKFKTSWMISPKCLHISEV